MSSENLNAPYKKVSITNVVRRNSRQSQDAPVPARSWNDHNRETEGEIVGVLCEHLVFGVRARKAKGHFLCFY